MSELVNLIDNIETTRFETFGVDDPSAMGQPYWGIDMDRATDEALRNIIKDIYLIASNIEEMPPKMQGRFRKIDQKFYDDIFRIWSRYVDGNQIWVYEDVVDLNKVTVKFIESVIDVPTDIPKEIISIQ
ncbi:hypothetical protein CFBP4996_15395 [Agrobacterium leguminum]|uniref:hypothetical protein n=1 Tax=Agrobacterium TaxID=357 RepID=UPI0009BB3260|nr:MULTISPECIES: hypothetical protein [Agrobacterium]WFS67412.1 hypothetical protein CFBP4996_15395 [Agrobacterium leguminum]